MRINLQEIPDEGREFVINNQTGELNQVLQDLIGNQAFNAEFTIRPTNTNTFELHGFIKTHLPEQCSRCGLDFKMPVNAKFTEMLIPRQEMPRDAHYTKANHFSDMAGGGPSVLEYDGHHFEMGEYIHEVIALEEPFNPVAPVDQNDDCTVCKLNVKTHNFGYDEGNTEEKTNPFGVLKNLKLN